MTVLHSPSPRHGTGVSLLVIGGDWLWKLTIMIQRKAASLRAGYQGERVNMCGLKLEMQQVAHSRRRLGRGQWPGTSKCAHGLEMFI
jgi:hypothetical protein